MESMATGVAAADNTPAFPDLALATILSSTKESQVPQSGHLPIHLGA
jgi:hypothetical protein